jgi:hypothetical protein
MDGGCCLSGDKVPSTTIYNVTDTVFGCKPGYYMAEGVCWQCPAGTEQLSERFVGSSCTPSDELGEVPWVSTIHECGAGRVATPAQCTAYAEKEEMEYEVGMWYDRPLGCFR